MNWCGANETIVSKDDLMDFLADELILLRTKDDFYRGIRNFFDIFVNYVKRTNEQGIMVNPFLDPWSAWHDVFLDETCNILTHLDSYNELETDTMGRFKFTTKIAHKMIKEIQEKDIDLVYVIEGDWI